MSLNNTKSEPAQTAGNAPEPWMLAAAEELHRVEIGMEDGAVFDAIDQGEISIRARIIAKHYAASSQEAATRMIPPFYGFERLDGTLDELESRCCTCGAWDYYFVNDAEPPSTWGMCIVHRVRRDIATLFSEFRDKPVTRAEPAPSPATKETRLQDFDDDDHPFRKWWEKHGQFMMAGGGRRESIWAARGWIAREQLSAGVEVTGEGRLALNPPAEVANESASQGPATKETPQDVNPPLTEAEIARVREVAKKIVVVDHPKTYPDSAHDLFDELTTLLYNEGGRWRVQAELADGTHAIIAVNNIMDGELARVQIRGIALELLGHFLKSQDAKTASSQGPAREETYFEACQRERTVAKLMNTVSRESPNDSAMEQLFLAAYDAGAKSVVAAPQNQIGAIERSSRRIAGNPAICSQTYSREWRIEHIQEVLESELAGAAALPSAPIKFPAHKCGLFLSHNEHRDYYEKLADYLAEGDFEDGFESPEAMQRAILTDEHWCLHWYPNTPVGFNRVSAPTLEEVLRLANEGEIPSPPVPSKEPK